MAYFLRNALESWYGRSQDRVGGRFCRCFGGHFVGELESRRRGGETETNLEQSFYVHFWSLGPKLFENLNEFCLYVTNHSQSLKQ